MQPDLVLAKRAIDGDVEALRAIDELVAGLPVSDEARQLVRQKALVEGKLEDFDGRGPLRLWLKTIALRVEVDLRRATREDAVEDRVLDRLIPCSPHEEKELITRESRAVLKEALGKALAALPERDRLFVQHYHLDGLTLSAIGELYQVAPSTVMRALGKAIDQLRALVQQHLIATHQLGLASLESLVRAGVD